MRDTRSSEYASRLRRVQGARWKQYAPNPYRTWLRNQELGFTLDVGCGLGRSLMYLDGEGVGIDHNEDFVAACREKGLAAFTPSDFLQSDYARAGRFDSLICMHVLEHLDVGQAQPLLSSYLRYVRPGGKVVLVTPQELGYRSDSTHTHFVDGAALEELASALSLVTPGWRSFPLPRWAGRAYIYNEFHLVARTPDPGADPA